MQDYVVNRPEEGAMNRILAEDPSPAAVAILRLAWQAGLLRQEIVDLTWSRIDLLGGNMVLSDRVVPLCADLTAFLTALRSRRFPESETVVLSDRDGKPLTPQSVSRLARQALDRGGQRAVRLIDLRHDFVLRQLETHDWQHVSRVTGIEAAALRAHFAPHLAAGRVSTRAEKPPAPLDEYRLWQALQAERGTAAGAALWLSWQLGLKLEEMVSLHWEQINFETSTLELPDQTLPLPAPLAKSSRPSPAPLPAWC